MVDFTLLRPWMLGALLLPLIFIYVDFARNYKLQSFIKEDIINFLIPKRRTHLNENDAESEDEVEETRPGVQKITEEERKDLIAKPKLWKKYGWLLIPYVAAVIAMAGPAVKQKSDLFQTDENWVWLIDSSPSMMADDLKPSRFQRVRYSLIELLNASKQHRRISIMGFTSNTYVVTPLTDDTSTLLFSLQEMSPEIMPVLGSDPLQALEEAEKVLDREAESQRKLSPETETPGNILLVTDDIKDENELIGVSEFIKRCKYPVYIYAIGTNSGKPVRFKGELMHDSNGETVMARSHIELIQEVVKKSDAKVYYEFNDEAPHLEQMYSYEHPKYQHTTKSKYQNKDIGYLFLLISLLSIFGFVRNYFFAALFAVMLGTAAVSLPAPAMADVTEMDDDEGLKHPNEYGYLLYKDRQYDKALNYLTDHMWRGNTWYRLGRYDKALQEYQNLGNNDAEAKYNIGNCFAHMNTPGALKDAILAYEQALELNPEHAEASYNKSVILEHLRKLDEINKARQVNVIDESSAQSLNTAIADTSTVMVDPGERISLLQKRFILQQKKKKAKGNLEQLW